MWLDSSSWFSAPRSALRKSCVLGSHGLRFDARLSRERWKTESSSAERGEVRDDGHHVSTVRDYGRVLWRRKWIVLLVACLATGVAVYLSQRQDPVYSASADVLLRHDNFAGTLAGLGEATGGARDPARVSQTQADLARVRPLAAEVVRAARAPMTARELLRNSSVTSKANSDILTFSVESEDRALATRLATAYARGYTDFRRRLDTSAIERARSEAKARLNELEASGQGGSALYANLDEKLQLLNTMAALQTSNAFLVEPADRAEPDLASAGPHRPARAHAQPHPRRRARVPLRDARYTCPIRGRDRDSARAPATRANPGTATEDQQEERSRHHRRAEQRQCRGVPDPADEPRVRRSRPAGEDDHGDLRGRG